MRLFVLWLVIQFTPFFAFAANVELLNAKPTTYESFLSDPTCNMTLGGDIEVGDSERIKMAFRKTKLTGGGGVFVTCLDSGGGMLKEAVEISRFFIENHISTYVDRDSKCYSACSIIFMAGTMLENDDSVSWGIPSRAVHPEASLGFHSPRLEVQSGTYTDERVGLAYTEALSNLADVGEALVLSGRMRIDLFLKMLRTPSEKILVIDDIKEATIWGIEVRPLALTVELSEANVRQACANLRTYFLPSEQLWDIDLVAEAELQVVDSMPSVKKFSLSISEMDERGCDIEISEAAYSARFVKETDQILLSLKEEGAPTLVPTPILMFITGVEKLRDLPLP